MQETQNTAYWNLSVEKTEHLLQTNAKDGLAGSDAASRLELHGYNELKAEKKAGLAAKFFRQFKSVMILILLGAACIAGVVGYTRGEGVTDALIILAIVIVNACIGVAQENKAENALAALEKMSAPRCKVLRDGQVGVIEARNLVPGDVVVMEAGDLIPADLRLIESVNLTVQESALTGESLSQDKHTAALEGDVLLGDRENMAFASGIVAFGRGKGIVTATGMHSEMGKIAGMLQDVPDTKTPMQKKIDRLGIFLGVGAVGACICIFAAGIMQGREMLGMFMIAISLAVAAIPEGLPAVSTIVLAVGMQRLAFKKAVVRNLPSVEALGGVTVICSDKTGTLTQNRMTVTALFTDGRDADIPEQANAGQKQAILAGVLANGALLSHTPQGATTTGDPTETALLELGLRLGMDKNELEAQFPRTAEIPFDSERKMMSSINRDANGHLTLYTKGGVDEILDRCSSVLLQGNIIPLDAAYGELIRSANQDMAQKTLRVLAVAYRPLEASSESEATPDMETDLIFCGLLGMMDPPREEAGAAVAACREAGIRPVMITGDHTVTAVAIAQKLGIIKPGEASLSGADLEKMPEAEFNELVGHTAVFARVAPAHKVRIVKALQKQGAVVAMTGDGVNDAPALKLADIGVAMGITGTDVSKQAADIVLADDNFSTIVGAVEEGRRIYDNLLKAIQFLLATNIGEVLIIFTAVLCNWATPLLPVQILWINLVTDSLPALALSVDPADADVMRRKPVDAKAGILHPGFLLRLFWQGGMIAALSLGAFAVGMQKDVPTAQTMAFAVLAFSQVIHSFNVRSQWRSALPSMFNNKPLLGALALVLSLMVLILLLPALHDIFHVVPLRYEQWLWVIGLSLMPLPFVEAVKLLVRMWGGRGDIPKASTLQ